MKGDAVVRCPSVSESDEIRAAEVDVPVDLCGW